MIDPVSLLPLSAAFLSAALIVTAGLAPRRRTLAAVFFLGLNASTLLWSFAYFLQLNWSSYADPALAPFGTYDYALVWITSLGVSGAPTYWFLFAAATARSRFWTSPAGIALAHVPLLYTIVVSVTNPWHGLFLSPGPGGMQAYGPLALPHFAGTFLLVLAGIRLLTKGAAAAGTRVARRRAIALGLASTVPLIGGLVFALRLIEGDPLPINPTPVLFPVLNVMLAYQVMRGELGDIVPLSTLSSLMENTDAHLAYMDREYVMISANSAFIGRSGHSESEIVGHGFFELFADGERRSMFDRVRDTGVAAEGQADTGWFRETGAATVSYWNWRLSPVSEPTGEVVGLVLSLLDVTEAVRERELAEQLNALSSRLHAGIRSDEVLRSVVAEAGGAVGSASSSIALLRDQGMSVMQHCERPDASWEPFAEEDLPHIALAMRARRIVEVRDALTDERVNPTIMRALGLRAALVVPMLTTSGIIGAVSFGQEVRPRAFSAVQVDFARRLSQAMTLAYENSRLYETEHRIAETLQESMLTFPREIRGIEFADIYRSATEIARVGGDFYDLFELEEGLIGVLVGDVSGKGLEAAVLTSLVKNTVRANAYQDHSPSTILTRTNEIVRRQTDTGVFATAFFCIVEPFAGRLTYSNAGHPPALIVSPEGAVRQLGDHSSLLGAFEDLVYTQTEVDLGESDALLLYTDGVTEARSDGDMFGVEGLVSAAASLAGAGPRDLVQGVFEQILEYTSDSLSDDVVLLALRLAACSCPPDAAQEGADAGAAPAAPAPRETATPRPDTPS